MNLDPEVLEATFTNEGEDLQSISKKQPVFLVFLRHFGCTFCREAMSDLASIRKEIEAKSVKIIMVHMATEEVAKGFFKNYDLAGVAHISDPDLSLYEYFGLLKGKFGQLYGLKIWLRALKVAFVDGHGAPTVKKGLGPANQMPGVFLLKDGDIKAKFLHKNAAERPDYLKIVTDYLSKH